MHYLIGAALGLGIGLFATVVGFDRARSFYPVVLVVIASYYDLFAVMGGSTAALLFETVAWLGFTALAVLGFRTNLWIVVAALAGHGAMDLVHGHLIANPGVPGWWPMFCLTFDVAAAAYLATRLLHESRHALDAGARRAVRSSARAGRLRAAVAAALLAGSAFGASGCTAAPSDVRTAEVDGHTVAYRVLGHGRPVLVLISGLGDGMASFQDVAPELAKAATVIVYDRAGYGGSDAPSGPRDAASVDRELSGLLKASGVAGPYVIAGHSIGGLYAEYFAAAHPADVAGLILEESRPAGFTERCEAAKIAACVATPAMMRFSPKGAQQEVEDLAQTVAEVASAKPISGKPVLVLSRALVANPKPFDALWTTAQRDLGARYSVLNRPAPGGGHYIHRDERAWFVTTVGEFLRKSR